MSSAVRSFREAARRGLKLMRLVRHPAWRRGLRHGVGAAVEHKQVSFSPEFATVLDVGAHRGQFALFARQRFPGAKLYCFEPLPDARGVLNAVLGETGAEVFPLALSSRSGVAPFHVSRRDDSSSLLPIGERQTAAFPGTEESCRIEVRVTRLDDVLRNVDTLHRPCLLKIDVQGHEVEVLRGALDSLRVVDEVLVECSFQELYEGQPGAEDVVDLLRGEGFRLAGVFSISHDWAGRQLQGDFLFIRTPGHPPPPTLVA